MQIRNRINQSITDRHLHLLTALKPGNPRTDTCDTERQPEKKNENDSKPGKVKRRNKNASFILQFKLHISLKRQMAVLITSIKIISFLYWT